MLISNSLIQADNNSLFLFKASEAQARYIELLTRSGDYYKFLSEMLKSMEDLKVICLFYFLYFLFLSQVSAITDRRLYALVQC